MSQFKSNRYRGLAQQNGEVGTGRPDAQQVGVPRPPIVTGIRGYSVKVGNHQDVYVDGNDTDHERPVPSGLLRTDNYNYTYDEGTDTWNRQRGNYNELIIPLAARTVAVTSGVMDNFNHRGGHFMVNVTAIGAVALTPTIYGYDPSTGMSYVLLNDPAGVPFTITATGIYLFKIYPGIAATVNRSASDMLPRFFTFGVSPSAAVSATYSVSLNLVV